MDQQETCLITSNETYRQYVETQNQLKLRDYGQVITRLEELHLNFHSGGNTGAGYLEQLSYGPMGDYIQDMLRKEDI